jgi:hypothetical protein
MAKFEEVFADTKELFEKRLADCGLEQHINVKILAVNKQKELGKVVKANDLLKHMTSEDVVILLNEVIFEQLEDNQKVLVVDELLAEIYFDTEKGKVVIVKPDIQTFSLLLEKYTLKEYLRLKETVKAILAAKEEEEAA